MGKKKLKKMAIRTADENLMALLSVFDGWFDNKAVIDEESSKWSSQKILDKLAKLGFEYPDLNEDYTKVMVNDLLRHQTTNTQAQNRLKRF